MKRFLTNLIFGIYAIIAVFATVCLLSFNKYKVTEFGNYSLVIININNQNDQYKKGDLVIVDKNRRILTGEDVFFYDIYDQRVNISIGEVDAIEKVSDTENTYTLKEGERKISGEYVLGSADNTTKFAFVGSVLSVLESRWGFLFLIVLPALIAFLYQITVVVSEIKGNKEEKE